jgi:hypothetical protein
MGKVTRLELWWQLYVTWRPVRDLENFKPLDFCWTEGTRRINFVLAQITGCRLDGMGLIISTIIYVHRHFKALQGVYPPICWLRGVKLELTTHLYLLLRLRLHETLPPLFHTSSLSWRSAGGSTLLSELMYRECQLPSDSYLEQDGFAVHHVHVFWKNKIWIFHGTNHFVRRFSPGTNRELRCIKTGFDEFVTCLSDSLPWKLCDVLSRSMRS